jgi:hypothetical protein
MNAEDVVSSGGNHPERVAMASQLIWQNAEDLARRVSALFADLGMPIPAITSGYRDPISNKAEGGATKSSHLEGKAVDLADVTGMLGRKIAGELELLARHGLWQEHPDDTKGKKPGHGWVHLQSRPVKGRRVFYR